MILVYNPIAASACFALKALGLDFVVLGCKGGTLEDYTLGDRFGFEPYTGQNIETLVTSDKSFDKVRPYIISKVPKKIIWDLGRTASKAELNRRIKQIAMPLQVLGYSSSILYGLSSHTLGFNIMETRSVLVATYGREAPFVAPSGIAFTKPYQSLENILKRKNDHDIDHEDPTGLCNLKAARKRTIGIEFLKEPYISPTTGMTWVIIREKWHICTISEVANMYGYPIEAQKTLTKLVEEHEKFGIYLILKDLSFPLWKDMIERSGVR